MIAIVDYGSGNVASIANIFKQLRIPCVITNDSDELRAADRYILPGVGAFDATMRILHNSGIVNLLHDQVIVGGKPLLGICVGMQILGSSSDEGVLPGLGWIPGRIRRIDAEAISGLPKLPHMGWNSVQHHGSSDLFNGVDLERGFYFLHNYYFDAENSDNVMATMNYGKEMPCGVAKQNVYGLQFHPEKSHTNGVAILRNFSVL